MHEIELKFVLDEPAEKRLRENPALSRLAEGKAATESLHSIYFDTADRALKANGLALRLRRKGRRWVQTVKARRGLSSGLSSAEEAESTAPGGRLALDRVPDAAIREALQRHLDGRAPEPVCETRMRRTTRALVLDDGSRVELAIDVGEVRAGDRAEPWREAELELKSGAPAALFRAARLLFPEGGLEFSTLTKAERGYLLAGDGRIKPPVEPRKARAVALARGLTTGEAATGVMREGLDQVAANVLAVVGRGDDPEGPHQLRIGLRRLRAAFAVFRPAIGREALATLNDEARWLGREVGRLRDLDVVRHDLVGPEAACHPDDAGFATLTAALDRAAAAERDRLRVTLKSARAHALLLDLAAFVETQAWLRPGDAEQAAALARPVKDHARQALGKTWKRASKRAKGIERLSVEQRHALRKALKRLRYAVEFFAPLYPGKKVRPFLKRLKRLQDDFGDLNDVAVAEALFSGPDAPAAGDAAAERAIGLVIGARRERAEQAWASARADWRALKATPRFWA